MTRLDGLRRYTTAIVSVGIAAAMSATLIGGILAKLGAALLVVAVVGVGVGLLQRAKHYRLISGLTALFLLVPLGGLGFVLRISDAPRIERWAHAVDITIATVFGSAAVLVFVGGRIVLLARRSAAGTPWATLAAGGPDHRARRTGRMLLTAGVLLVASGLSLAVIAPRGFNGLGTDWSSLAILAILAIVALVVAPVLAAVAAVGNLDRIERDRAMQRQAVAAHIHDSVLQTFALVQRRLDDPDESRRLIRRQERELRDWLAGRDAQRPDALGGALQQVADDVEAELHVPIELESLGDRPVVPEVGHMLDAAREALRNAARHGGGAPVRVLAVVDGPTTEIYIRDDGPGFVLDTVPTNRRGVRDAIIGRMTAVGGSATIDAAPGTGTEVVLRLTTRTDGAR